MKAIISVAILAFVALIISIMVWALFMHTETVEPGHNLVVVDKPYMWGHEGVQPKPITEGRVLLWRSSSVYDVVMTPQAEHVKFDDFSSGDNILLDFESTIQYQVTNAVDLVSHFGDKWFANDVNRQYAAIVREALKKKTMTQMMSDAVAAQDVDNEVTGALQRLVQDQKLPVRILGVSLGRAKPNENVLLQMNETAAQQQRQKTLSAAAIAEGNREVEQIAKAKADNAYRNAMQLSPDMFIQLERIKRYADACRDTKGTCIVDATGHANVMVGK